MSLEQDVEYLNEHLSVHIEGLVPPSLCKGWIDRYEHGVNSGRSADAANEVVSECGEQVFTERVNELIRRHIRSGFRSRWPQFDVVDASAASSDPNTFWHLDGGVTNTLKLFVYLNPVSEHGGNTPIIDLARTNRLRGTGWLGVTEAERKQDVTGLLEALGLDTGYLTYDLKAGDALLFNPLLLAHKRLLPREGKKRYTVCFHVVPS